MHSLRSSAGPRLITSLQQGCSGATLALPPESEQAFSELLLPAYRRGTFSETLLVRSPSCNGVGCHALPCLGRILTEYFPRPWSSRALARASQFVSRNAIRVVKCTRRSAMKTRVPNLKEKMQTLCCQVWCNEVCGYAAPRDPLSSRLPAKAHRPRLAFSPFLLGLPPVCHTGQGIVHAAAVRLGSVRCPLASHSAGGEAAGQAAPPSN